VEEAFEHQGLLGLGSPEAWLKRWWLLPMKRTRWKRTGTLTAGRKRWWGGGGVAEGEGVARHEEFSPMKTPRRAPRRRVGVGVRKKPQKRPQESALRESRVLGEKRASRGKGNKTASTPYLARKGKSVGSKTRDFSRPDEKETKAGVQTKKN